MIAVHARYRGREKGRAAVVERSAQALSSLPGVAGFEVLYVGASPDDFAGAFVA